jgi:two-component system, cell cycle response regulator
MFKVLSVYLFIAYVPPCLAEIDYADLSKLEPISSEYRTLNYDQRIKWLNNKLNTSLSDLEKYRIERILFQEQHFNRNHKEAAETCDRSKPLREDFLYREMCAISTFSQYKDVVQVLLQVIHDAQQSNNLTAATQVLINLAWRQSQNGDIAAAFDSYELALAIAPESNIELLNTAMMDSATNYIVHGDTDYIRKGIGLLDKIRQQSQSALKQLPKGEVNPVFNDNILLTNFNTGIAYALHLYEYDQALVFFDRINTIDSPYLISSLSFSAMAASELRQYERAKAYVNQIGSEIDPDPLVEHYLKCYRQLAIRHWDKNEELSACLTLFDDTTIEVQLDVYKRLANIEQPSIQLAGLKLLKKLFIEKLEPQLRARGSKAASNTELKRLQRESDLKTVVLQQQEELQQEREATHANRQMLFISLFVILLAFVFLIKSQLKQKKRLAEQFEQMSISDPLTKLGNRRFVERQIDRELAYVSRAHKNNENIALGIFLFDIDHFKKINDTYGHNAGDEVLVEISKRISKATRDTDILARWGGEEFLYVARVDNNERIYHLSQRILASINAHEFIISGHPPIKVTCTLGVVKYPFIDTDNIELWTRLISLADAALYYGKQAQRNCWVMINSENISKKEEIDMVLKSTLDQAIEKGLISLQTSFESN